MSQKVTEKYRKYKDKRKLPVELITKYMLPVMVQPEVLRIDQVDLISYLLEY